MEPDLLWAWPPTRAQKANLLTTGAQLGRFSRIILVHQLARRCSHRGASMEDFGPGHDPAALPHVQTIDESSWLFL